MAHGLPGSSGPPPIVLFGPLRNVRPIGWIGGRYTTSNPIAAIAANRFVALVCRDQGTTSSGYRFSVVPASGTVAISRVDGGAATALAGPSDASALLHNQVTNRVELSCVGPNISGRINGTEVASAQDGAYKSGGLLVAAGADAGGPLTVEAHFRNLVVTAP